MQPKEQSRDNGGDALSQPQPQIDREIDHTVQRVFTQAIDIDGENLSQPQIGFLHQHLCLICFLPQGSSQHFNLL